MLALAERPVAPEILIVDRLLDREVKILLGLKPHGPVAITEPSGPLKLIGVHCLLSIPYGYCTLRRMVPVALVLFPTESGVVRLDEEKKFDAAALLVTLGDTPYQMLQRLEQFLLRKYVLDDHDFGPALKLVDPDLRIDPNRIA